MRAVLTVALLVVVAAAEMERATAQVREAPTSELIQSLSAEAVDVRRDAAYELTRRADFSPEVIAALGQSVSDADTQVRFQSLLALAHAGAAAQPAIPGLLKCLDDRDDQIRFRAADALGKIGPAAISPLADQWPQATDRSKIASAQALALIGPDASSMSPLLEQAVASGQEGLPRYAAEALVAISPSDEAALLKFSQHADGQVRRIGIVALANLREPSELATAELQRALIDADPKIRETAVIALARSRLSPSAKADSLELALQDEVPAVRAAALVALRKSSLPGPDFARRIVAHLPAANLETANTLIKTIGVIGSDAQDTFPDLLAVADREGLDQLLLSQTFASFGESVVPGLLTAIEEQPTSEPMFSQALALIGEPAVESLIIGTSSDVELVRTAAIRALGGMRPLNTTILEKVASGLEDPAAKVREVAVDALISAGQDGSFAKDSLLQATQDKEPTVRAAAMLALVVFDYSNEEVRTACERGLHDPTADVRISTLRALNHLPQVLQSQIPELVALAAEEDSRVRSEAVHILGRLDKDRVNAEVVSALVTALADSDVAVRIAATGSVKALGLAEAKVLEALSSNLSDDLELLRLTVDAIAGCGEKASPLVPDVFRLVAHEQSDVRVAAVNALAAIDTDRVQLAARLTEVLEDPQWEVRRVAGVALGKLGPEAIVAVPKLFGLLSREEDSDYASSALREIDAAPVEAMSLLMEKLGSEERRVGYYAVVLLGKIGPPAAAALPKLEQMLQEPASSSSGRRSDFRKTFLREAIAAIKGEAVVKDDK